VTTLSSGWAGLARDSVNVVKTVALLEVSAGSWLMRSKDAFPSRSLLCALLGPESGPPAVGRCTY